MRECCVSNCASKTDKNFVELSFHEFPSNGTLRDKWIESIPALKTSRIHQDIRKFYICSLHFRKEDYMMGKIRRLKKYAVPTIFSSLTYKKEDSNVSWSKIKDLKEFKLPKNIIIKTETEAEVILGAPSPNLNIHPNTETQIALSAPIPNPTFHPNPVAQVVLLPPPNPTIHPKPMAQVVLGVPPSPTVYPKSVGQVVFGAPSSNKPISNIPISHADNLNPPMLPKNIFILPQSYINSPNVYFYQNPNSVASFQDVSSIQSPQKKPEVEIQKPINHIMPPVKVTPRSVDEKKSVYSQTELNRSEAVIKLEESNRKLRHESIFNYRKIKRLSEQVTDLQEELEMYKKKEKNCNSNKFHKAMDIIYKDAQDPEKDLANIILEQVQNYNNQRPRFSIRTVRKFGSWFFKFPDSYNHVIKENILKLPRKSTLFKFANKVSCKIDLPPNGTLTDEDITD